MMPGVPDPWLFLMDRHPEVKVYLRADLGRRWGQTVWRDGVPEIHLAVDLGRIQRRCTLAHELHHVMRGAPCRPLCPQDEADVIDETARFLLPDLRVVATALARWDLPAAAEQLQVTRNVLTERVDSLSDEEIAELAEMIEAATEPADGQAALAVCVDSEKRSPRRATRVRKHSCRRVLRESN
ncbi:MAG TPA: hypothetical protein VHC18_18330 [Amycolatopsis sp.]|jgi:hypothetical protein|nr:hypothetical protein [Amycolatopsis sp.]